MPPLPVGAAWDPQKKKWYNTDTMQPVPGVHAPPGVVGPNVVPDKKGKKTTTVPGKNNQRAALIAKYIAGLKNGKTTTTPGVPDYSGQVPSSPNFDLYTGDTLPDYGAGVKDANFGPFRQGRVTSVDPKAYARITGEAYTPLLNQLKSQQAGYQAGLQTGNAQIESAYNSASDLATQARERILGTGASTAAANNAANAALVGSAGNDPLAAAAATQANAANQRLGGALSSIDAQGAGDSAAAAQRQKAAGLLDYGNAVSEKTNALGLQYGQTALAQGQDKQKALMDALSFNDSMKTSGLNRDVTAQAAKLANALAAGQITAQDLQNAVTRSGLTKAQQDSLMQKVQFNNSVKQDSFNNVITKVNSVAQLKSLFQQSKQAGVEIDVTKLPAASAASVDDTAYQNMEEQLIKPSLGADGASLVNPRKLYDQVFRAVNQRDGTTPKAVKAALARRLVQGTLNTYNTKNADDGQWYWDGNTFSQRKAKKK